MTHNVFTDDDSTLPDGTYEVLPDGELTPSTHLWGHYVSITNNRDLPSKTLVTLARDTMAMDEVYIGVWTDPEGKRFIDLTVHVSGSLTAWNLAKLFNQQAIWDIEVGAAIFLEPSK